MLRDEEKHMKKMIDFKRSLKKIKVIILALLAVSSLLIVFDKVRYIGIIMVIVLLIAEWKWYRCLNCKESLDPRMNIDENTYCPRCGKKI